MRVEISGPFLEIYNVTLQLDKYIWDEWYVEGVSLTIKNVGDCPAYISSIYVYSDQDYDYESFDTIVVPQGQEKYVSIDGLMVDLGKSGTYSVRVVIYLGSMSFNYTTQVTVPP